MNNDKILESWNLQFQDQKRLNYKQTKELINLANVTEDEKLKKEYFNQAILGTQYVIYNFLKTTKIHCFSSTETPTEDIIATVYETWIEYIKNNALKENETFSKVTFSNKFSNKVMEKLGIRQQLRKKPSDKYSTEFNNMALHRSNIELTEFFMTYYIATNSGQDVEEALNKYETYKTLLPFEKDGTITFFKKITNYIETSTDYRDISPANIRNYIEMIIANTISNDSLEDEILIVTYRYDDNEIYRDFSTQIDNALNSLTDLQNEFLRKCYGFDENVTSVQQIEEEYHYNKNKRMALMYKALSNLKKKNREQLEEYKDLLYK